MTTGVRRNDEMVVLVGGRMLIDVLRTIAHEWVHEYQIQKMGVSVDKPIQDIGGPIENMASILGSIYMKKFQNLKKLEFEGQVDEETFIKLLSNI